MSILGRFFAVFSITFFVSLMSPPNPASIFDIAILETLFSDAKRDLLCVDNKDIFNIFGTNNK